MEGKGENQKFLENGYWGRRRGLKNIRQSYTG